MTASLLESVTVKGLDEAGQRISSKIFEEKVQEAIRKSNQLVLETYGQHNVGGRLRHDSGTVSIRVKGPCGQRLGCMGQPNTRILCEGPASDDVGYLNIGAEITVLGNATNGVCNATAQGRVYIGGSIGARGLTMTKWNPDHERPELWVLGSVGDTFAEFNCGGIAVICGVEPKAPENVLGYRPCVGMVGGWIYYRGKTDGSFSKTNVREATPDDQQWQWLLDRLPEYLARIGRSDLLATLSARAEWKMLIAITPQERALLFSGPMPMQQFRDKIWRAGFAGPDAPAGGDPLRDLAPGLDRSPVGVICTDELRRRRPYWANQEYAAPCTFYCPTHIPTVDRLRLLREGKVTEAYKLILNYTPLPASICGAICPNLCMQNCSRQAVDQSIDVAMLGRAVRDADMPDFAAPTGGKVAIIGAGPGGMNAAWQLAQAGIEAHLFEKDTQLGGKLAQVIPWDRLAKAVWDREIDRFSKAPNIRLHLGTSVSKEMVEKFRQEYDYVIIAVGTHEPRRLPFPGSERAITALDFLRAAKSAKPLPVGKQVVIIGAGNVGCDVACEAYRLGAEQVTLVDIQKPLAFGKEKAAAEALGAVFKWPVSTREVTEAGLVAADGTLLPAQTVIISIGDIPAIGFLPESIETVRAAGGVWIKTDATGRTSDPKVLAVGDVERPGLATNALGSGRQAAQFIIAALGGKEWKPFGKKVVIPDALTLAHYCPQPLPGTTPEAEADRCASCGTCRDCHLCETICPTNAISRRDLGEMGYEYVSDDSKCIACGFCRDTCPCGVWAMRPLN